MILHRCYPPGWSIVALVALISVVFGEEGTDRTTGCAHSVKEFDELTQKKTYFVGVHAPAGVETAWRMYNLTFESYLNEAVGKRFSPPIEFRMKTSDNPLEDWIDKREEIDFMYTDTGVYSCIGSEIGAQPLGNTIARMKSRGKFHELDIFSGTMLVLADNDEINSIEDLKDKVIGAQAYSDFAGAQAQFFVMHENGLDYIVDPKQIVFTGNNDETVKGVLDGRWEVGFVRTGHVETVLDDSTGQPIDPSLFKVIEPKIYVMDNGDLFPFLHSTPVFPEWPFSAKKGVDKIVSEEVVSALMNLGYHHNVGKMIHQCMDEATTTDQMNVCLTMPPAYFDPTARCDTTRDLAELAYQAGVVGSHVGFRPPRSHFGVRNMQEAAGFIVEGKKGYHCARASSLYDALTCREGHYKVPKDEFDSQCDAMGHPCPEGLSCYCKPCIKAYEVEVFQWNNGSSGGHHQVGCDKMSVCGSTEQKTPVTFHARDNRERVNATVTALLHFGQDSMFLPVTNLGGFSYEFGFEHSQRGTAILEIAVDGVQIPESPFRIEVVARKCPAGLVPTDNGECLCSSEAKASGECRPEVYLYASFDDEPFDDEHAGHAHGDDKMHFFESQHDHNETCDKMSLCGSVQQRKEIVFHAYDNLERENANITALIHLGHHSRDLPVLPVPSEKYGYWFSFTHEEVGVAILEVFANGIQIPDSPVRVGVTSRDCDADYPGERKTPNTAGECECSDDTVKIGGTCMAEGTFAAIISSVCLLFLAQMIWCYMDYKRKKSDEIWQVNAQELHFGHPVEVIGQGAFGVVLLADYHGTKVAIKRVLPLREKRKGRTGSVAGNSVQSKNDTSDPNDDKDESSQSRGDIESSGEASFIGNRRGSLDMGSSKGGTLDFLGGISVGRKRTGWKKWLPFASQDDGTSFNRNLLGTSSGGSSAHRTLYARLLPWCDETTVRQNEFKDEMRLLSRLRHPCITTVMGAVMNGYEPMMVMEYMENGSLYDLLRNETLYTGGEIILQIVRDVAQGLRFLHASKPPILHGDLKAKNILVDSRFRAKVADFGLATKSKNGVVGTPYWMAPEYLRRKTEYTTACDIYAFGIIVYEIYSRKIPYEGQHPRKILRKVCDPRINHRPEVPGSCPKKMAGLMQKCWHGDAFFRPEAKELDLIFTEMIPSDAEPIVEENVRVRTVVASGDMLYQVFPKKVAEQLKAGQKVEPETHDIVTVFFSDIVGFTDISRALPPVKVMQMLDRLYHAFDDLAGKHGVFKVETIGDAWMGVTNLDGDQNDSHVKRIAAFAVDAVAAAGTVQVDEDDPLAGCVHIRVGLHSGAVVSNVIGSLNPRYGLFGDTVNTASRMESLSLKGRIQCSEASAKILKVQAPDFPLRKRGKLAVKGKGSMTAYWVGDGDDTLMHQDQDWSSKMNAGHQPIISFNSEEDFIMSSPLPKNKKKKKKKERRHFPTRVGMDGALATSNGPTSAEKVELSKEVPVSTKKKELSSGPRVNKNEQAEIETVSTNSPISDSSDRELKLQSPLKLAETIDVDPTLTL